MNESLWLSETVTPMTMLRWFTGVNRHGQYYPSFYTNSGDFAPPLIRNSLDYSAAINTAKNIAIALLNDSLHWPEYDDGNIVSSHSAPAFLSNAYLLSWIDAAYKAIDYETMVHYSTTIHDIQRRQRDTDCIRCIVGNPWRNIYCQCDPSVGVVCNWCNERQRLLHWQDGTIKRLAQNIGQEGSYDQLPILADALEEAGFDHKDSLNHLRGYHRCYRCLGLGDEEKTIRDSDRPAIGPLYKTKVIRVPCACQSERYVIGNTTYSKCVNGWRRFHTPHVRGCHIIEMLLGRY